MPTSLIPLSTQTWSLCTWLFAHLCILEHLVYVGRVLNMWWTHFSSSVENCSSGVEISWVPAAMLQVELVQPLACVQVSGSLLPPLWGEAPIPSYLSFFPLHFVRSFFCFKLRFVLQWKTQSRWEAGQNDATVQGQFTLISFKMHVSVQKDQGWPAAAVNSK